jgi:hypothetical protein
VEEDAYIAVDVAESMLLLRRRLEEDLAGLLAEAETASLPPAKPKRGWWPFGKEA